MIATLPAGLGTDEMPMADWLEGFVGVKQHVLVRFGKWQEISISRSPTTPSSTA